MPIHVRDQFEQLYREIHAEARRHDPQAVPRRVVARALASGVMVIAQALGSGTQRLSGIPYVAPGGALSRTGLALDRLVGGFGYTVDPRDGGRRYAYCTDMLPYYPGRGTGGDRPPTPHEVARCAAWLDRELTLLAPRVVVLLGGTAATGFFRRYLGRRPEPLAEIGGVEFSFDHEDRRISAFAVYHPAYRYGTPEEREEIAAIYEDTVEDIRTILEGCRADHRGWRGGQPAPPRT